MIVDAIDLTREASGHERRLDDVLAFARAKGPCAGIISLDALEHALGAPPEPAALRSLPDDPVAAGLIDLEIEILQDEIADARRAYADQLGAWRRSVPPDRIREWHARFLAAGFTVVALTCDDLVHRSDAEVDVACQWARWLGARAFITALTMGGARRLAPLTHRHGLVVAFKRRSDEDDAEFALAFGHGQNVGVALGDRDVAYARVIDTGAPQRMAIVLTPFQRQPPGARP